METMRVKPPRMARVKNIEKALEIYWSCPEIGNKEIKEIFDIVGSATVTRYKKLAQEKMAETGVLCRGLHCVNTEAAYQAWGIDAADLEKRLIKLQRLKQKHVIGGGERENGRKHNEPGAIEMDCAIGEGN